MRLKRLEIAGFKSFRDRVLFDFPAGITAVVGPNGCGKSNIVDAIRFAMGEQRIRSLRGKSMEDNIFTGSDDASPVGMAEVSLVLARGNEPFTGPYADSEEVMVTRRLYRGGDSEYFLNRVRCRHLDISEFFLGTGVGSRSYSLVEQNSVTMMVEAKPEELRLFIDEAAGISKYKGRRENAQRKLEATQQNLIRLGDIMAEVKSNLNDTARQAKKAAQFKDLRRQVREGEVTLAWFAYREMVSRRDQVCRNLEELNNHHLETQVKLAACEAVSEELQLTFQEMNGQVSKANERRYALTNAISMGEQKITFSREKRQELTHRRTLLGKELEEAVNLGRQLKEEDDRLTELIASDEKYAENLRRQIEEQEKKIEAARMRVKSSQREMEDKRGRSYSLATERVRRENQVAGLEKHLLELKRRVETREKEESELDKRLAETRDRLARLKDTLGHDQARWSELKTKKIAAEEQEQITRQEATDAEESLAGLRIRKGEATSRLRSLVEFRDGHALLAEGAKTIMEITDRAKSGGLTGLSPIGVIADFIDVPQEYETALEMALGEKLQYIAVETCEDAIRAIAYLKDKGAGRGSFAPLEMTADPQSVSFPADPGMTNRLIDLIAFQEEFRSLGEMILGDVYLVRSLEEGIELRSQGRRSSFFICPDGDLISPDGIISGGLSRNGRMSLLKNRREIKELEQMSAVFDQEIESLSREKTLALRAAENWRGEVVEIRSTQHHLEIQLNGTKKDIERFLDEDKRLKQRLAALSMAADQVARDEDSAKARLAELKNDLTAESIREASLNAELGEAKRDAEALQQALQEQEKVLLGDKVDEASVRQRITANVKALAKLRESLAEAARRQIERQRQIVEGEQAESELTENITLVEEALHNNYREMKTVDLSLEGLTNSLTASGDALRDSQKNLDDLRGKFQKNKEAMGRQEAAEREVSFQMESLRESLAAKYQVDLAGWLPDESAAEIDPAILREQVQQKKIQLERFGEVNLLALEEHQKLTERYDFFNTQVADLKVSIDSLNKTIARINRISRSRFSDTFEGINESFREVFAFLFPGGRGRLLLTNGDPLTAGIDMDIQIPGKKIQGMGLLSGGEKTLAAIALIFAIIRYRPAPFLILDEIDAALDDANISIFNRLIREITTKSQIIMVTHNKLSMEVAESLIGVTMQKKGISSVIAVNLN